ncbi:MAG: AraC family transcriptional regulator [Polaribacter sp.]|jgi:AraC-like DNA-binding protein
MLKKPTLEKINPDFGSSLLVRKHTTFLPNAEPLWHHHPEIELVYVDKGRGKRQIGNHVSYFTNSQLVLIGSNLPHVGFVDRLTTSGSETLVQFLPDFLGETFFKIPETQKIEALFERAKKGIRFNTGIKKKLGPKIQKLVELEGFEKMISLLEILHELALTDDYTLLNVNGLAIETESRSRDRIEKIYRYINTNFSEPISLEEISDHVSMTVPAFCRFFKKATGKTFTKVVNEYRIVHATKLLTESSKSISEISYECGFNNFSHFNKSFQQFVGKSASQYKNEIRNIIQ